MEASPSRQSRLEAGKGLKRYRYSRMSRDYCYCFISWDTLHSVSSLDMDLDGRTTDRHVTAWNCKMMSTAHSPTLKPSILLLKSRQRWWGPCTNKYASRKIQQVNFFKYGFREVVLSAWSWYFRTLPKATLKWTRCGWCAIESLLSEICSSWERHS